MESRMADHQLLCVTLASCSISPRMLSISRMYFSALGFIQCDFPPVNFGYQYWVFKRFFRNQIDGSVKHMLQLFEKAKVVIRIIQKFDRAGKADQKIQVTGITKIPMRCRPKKSQRDHLMRPA